MEDIKKFAEENGFDSVRDCQFTWNGYSVYYVYNMREVVDEDGNGLSLGYPSFALKNDRGIRLAKMVDETESILRAMPDDVDGEDA